MSIKLFACGDIVNTRSKKNFVNEELKDIIQKADISICNFEAPIETKGMKPIKKAGPHVYQSKESIEYLRNVGFNYVSLANNHIYDYGQEALENTIKELKKYDIDFVGAGIDFDEAYSTKIIEKNGIKIGLLSACENEFGCLYEKKMRGGYAWILHPIIEDRIKELKKTCDFVVLVAHAGIENIEVPIKEWRDRYKRFCDVGVDVIIGHHPHVPQGYEKYNKSLIFYSLGNFYFDTAGFENKSDDSFSVILEFKKDSNVKYKIVYHKKKDGQTCLVNKNEVGFDLVYLNSFLGERYKKLNDEISIRLFYQYYYDYYKIAVGGLPKNLSPMSKIKFIIKKIFFKNKDITNRNLLLLHNIRIDSHRFLVQRALSLISEEE